MIDVRMAMLTGKKQVKDFDEFWSWSRVKTPRIPTIEEMIAQAMIRQGVVK